jgi:hypothetical protein
MSDWISKVLSENGFKMPSLQTKIDDKLMDEEVVILLQGKNSFGDDIYSYLKVTIRNFYALTEFVKSRGDFIPSDYGSIIAAGTGEPSPELRSEMSITYNLIDIPRPVQNNTKISVAPPPLWDED